VSTDSGSPYRGLAPFQDAEHDVRFFFGRDRERELIEANLMASRLTVLYGEAGVGKSSVLRAGVAHHLRQVAKENLETRGEPGLAVVVFDEWRDDPVRALRAAVADEVTLALGGSIIPADDGGSLEDALGMWQDILGGELYIILDQTEELFLYHGGDDEPGTFGSDFPAIVNNPELRVNFLLALREDTLAKLDVFRSRIPNVLGNYLRLDHLDVRAGRSAIVEPVAEYNRLLDEGSRVEIEPALVDAVLEQVVAGKVEIGTTGRGAVENTGGETRIETPYLQLVMRRLWDEELGDGGRELRVATLRRLGGAEQIVRDHVEHALTDLTPAEKDHAAQLIDHLVTPSGSKIAHAVGDLAKYAGTSEPELLPVLAKLGNERILRSVAGDDSRGSRYELFHDVLAEPVLAWKAEHEASRALAAATELARKRHRRLAVVAGASLVALVLLGALTVFAFSQRSKSASREQTAKSRELAASALTQIGTDPELSLLLALQAANVQENPSVDSAMRTALLESRVRRVATLGRPVEAMDVAPGGRFVVWTRSETVVLDKRLRLVRTLPRFGRFLGVRDDKIVFLTTRGLELRRISDGHLTQLIPIRAGVTLEIHDLATGAVVGHVRMPQHVTFAALGPRGTLLAVSDGSDRVIVIDTLTGNARHELTQTSRVTALAFGPGARILATGGKDGNSRLYTVSTGRIRAVLRGHVGAVRQVAFSPTETLIASASNDGTARVFRLANGAPVAVMSGHSNPVTDVAFSPDGTRIITASADGTARVWKAQTGLQLAVLLGDQGAVTAARFAGDSFVVTGSDDGSVRLWYALAQPELALLHHFPQPVARAAFTPDGHVDAVTSDGRAHILAASGREIATRAAGPAPPLESTTGVSATVAGRIVTLHEPDGREVVLRGHTRLVTSVRFSSDGTEVVTASRDTTARIWDAATGALLVRLRGRHNGVVRDASFSPDGRWVVTAGPGTAALWSSDTGEFFFYLQGHSGDLTSASFDAAGDRILTSGVDGTVRTYVCEICRSGAALADVARARLEQTGRRLTPGERARFLR
jgi:WD40 repeat protein